MASAEKQESSILRDTLIAAYSMKIADLRKEIESYKNEANIWKVADGITNSGGNLCLHLVGNLNHFIGARIGNTGYVRDRDAEFSDTGLSRYDLLGRIDDMAEVVEATLAGLNDEILSDDYPEMLFDKQMDNGTVLAYMSGHLSYHLGQLNYHRRLLDK